MAWTAPRTWAAAETVTAALLNTHLRDNLKAIGDPWTTYVPTYAGLTIGNAVVTAKYLQAGKLVIGYTKIVFGSTSTFSGGFTVSLPVQAAVINLPVGPCWLNDTSAGTHYSVLPLVQSGGTTVAFARGDGTTATVSNTVPFTWANGDTLAFEFTYEAA